MSKGYGKFRAVDELRDNIFNISGFEVIEYNRLFYIFGFLIYSKHIQNNINQ